MEKFIDNYINNSIDVKKKILETPEIKEAIIKSVYAIIDAYKNGHKFLTAGNGGSAADAQHIAAELVAKFFIERPALNALALTTNSSILTAVGNDYGHEFALARQVQAYTNEGDVLLAISTSGNSKNILLAIDEAKKKGAFIIGLVGGKSCKMDKVCDITIKTPSEVTPNIQEAHIMIGHIICALVERELFERGN
ncbi:MAG: SIS domain-containing protein [bacterium]|nr:SIS domain-containing protein [bacterium]